MNLLNFGFGVTPQKAIRTLHLGVQKQLNKKLDEFSMVYNQNDKKIFILDGNNVTPYESDTMLMIFKMVKKVLVSKLEKNQVFDMVRLDYKTNESVFTICLTEDGKGIKQVHTINNKE